MRERLRERWRGEGADGLRRPSEREGVPLRGLSSPALGQSPRLQFATKLTNIDHLTLTTAVPPPLPPASKLLLETAREDAGAQTALDLPD